MRGNSKGFTQIILIIILLILLGAGAYYFIGVKKMTFVIPTPLPSPLSSISPSVGPTATPEKSTMTSIDSTWNLYTNNVFGFSIKVPKTAYEFAGICLNGKNDVAPVATKVFDDSKGAYITYESFYEFPVENACVKTINTLEIIDQRSNQWKTNPTNPLYDPPNWHIVTAKIENDTDLENFIKDNYGTGCKLGAKTLNSSGVYDVKVEGDGLDLSETKCPINFMLAIKYSPEFKKAATWGIGQSIVFAANKDFSKAYDTDIVNSFKFIK